VVAGDADHSWVDEEQQTWKHSDNDIGSGSCSPAGPSAWCCHSVVLVRAWWDDPCIGVYGQTCLVTIGGKQGREIASLCDWFGVEDGKGLW